MSIKDQCNNCRYLIDNNCSQLIPTYDGISCDKYVKKINLSKEKKELQEFTTASTNVDIEYQIPSDNNADENGDIPSDEKIHGWLKFFLIVFVGIGSIFSLIYNFATFESGDNFWISISDVVFAVVYLVVGIFTIVAFHKRDTDAVFLAKTFVILCFASNLLGLLTMDGEMTNTKVITNMIRSIFWCCIWFVFLCNSAQVKRLIPIEHRTTKTRDWIIISAVILLPLICIGLSISTEKKTQAEIEAAALLNITLATNQFSDGRIVLTIPEGVDCEESIAENTKYFTISDPETGTEATVVSDYDNDITKRNFNQYWHSWKSDEIKNLEYDIIEDDKKSIGDFIVFYKLIRINAENTIDWEFALVFDQNSGKVCLVSSYSNPDSNSLIGYIINNLKFL